MIISKDEILSLIDLLVTKQGNQSGTLLFRVLREMLNYSEDQRLKAQVVDTEEYPTLEDFLASEGKSGIIYLYPNGTVGTENRYQEYLWVESSSSYELLDEVTLDLSNYAQQDGTYPLLTVGDITLKSDLPITITNKFRAQPTGGDADLKSGAGSLLSIIGNLDAQMQPFYADTFVSTSMNLVDPTETFDSGALKAYYFPCVPGNWGTYGTTQENNGYVIVGGDVNNVFFKATKPTASSYGSACPKHTHGDRDYYTPEAIGWLVILCNTNEVPACHLAWSNYNDNVAGTFSNFTLDIEQDVEAIHPWGMAFLSGGGRTVYDEIDLVAKKNYIRTDRADLLNLAWTVTEDSSGEESVYTFSATVANMRNNGLWATDFRGFEVSGTTIIYSTSQISTVENFLTFLESYDKWFYFELQYISSFDNNLSSDILVDDFGLTYFMAAGEVATVAAFVAESFFQSCKDQLFNAVTYQKILAFVCAAALCQQDSRLSAIENNIKNGFNYLKVTNLDITRELTQPEGQT